MRIVLSPDAFKGSCTATRAAQALAEGVRRAAPAADVLLRPVADGGEGTVEVLASTGARLVETDVSGPLGRPMTAQLAVVGDTAVVELATAAGLHQVEGGPTPASARRATTYGVGQLVRAALDSGARRVVLAVGGSATTDGGAGMLQALGARLLDAAGADLAPGGAALADLDEIDLTGMDPRIAGTDIVVACDVDNPLLGPHGAAAVYGPQKGATPVDVGALDAALARFADVVGRATGAGSAPAETPGAGAAGGTAYGALAVLGGRLTPGIDLVLDLVGFHDAVHGADLVVTGEGRLDAQTLRGKAPAGVARAARRAGVPVVAVAGQVDLTADELTAAGLRAAYALTDLEPDTGRAIAQAEDLLTRTGERIATDHLTGTTTRPDPRRTA